MVFGQSLEIPLILLRSKRTKFSWDNTALVPYKRNVDEILVYQLENRTDIMQTTTKIKLTYFNLRGRAEPSRLILAYAGVDFDDCRVTSEEWQKLKPSKFLRNLNLFSLVVKFTATFKEVYFSYIYVWFISYLKWSNCRRIVKLLSNFCCSFTFCY